MKTGSHLQTPKALLGMQESVQKSMDLTTDSAWSGAQKDIGPVVLGSASKSNEIIQIEQNRESTDDREGELVTKWS